MNAGTSNGTLWLGQESRSSSLTVCSLVVDYGTGRRGWSVRELGCRKGWREVKAENCNGNHQSVCLFLQMSKVHGKAIEDERDCLVQVCVEVGRGLLLVKRKDQNDACFRNNPYEGDVP